MLEIVHDVARGPNFSSLPPAPGSRDSRRTSGPRAAGCDIIVDDWFYFVETPFQDGQARACLEYERRHYYSGGQRRTTDALYFSSAGNEGNLNDGTSGVWEGISWTAARRARRCRWAASIILAGKTSTC